MEMEVENEVNNQLQTMQKQRNEKITLSLFTQCHLMHTKHLGVNHQFNGGNIPKPQSKGKKRDVTFIPFQ